MGFVLPMSFYIFPLQWELGKHQNLRFCAASQEKKAHFVKTNHKFVDIGLVKISNGLSR